jgi:hypothetical protein
MNQQSRLEMNQRNQMQVNRQNQMEAKETAAEKPDPNFFIAQPTIKRIAASINSCHRCGPRRPRAVGRCHRVLEKDLF